MNRKQSEGSVDETFKVPPLFLGPQGQIIFPAPCSDCKTIIRHCRER